VSTRDLPRFAFTLLLGLTACQAAGSPSALPAPSNQPSAEQPAPSVTATEPADTPVAVPSGHVAVAIHDIGEAPCAVTTDGSHVWITDFRRHQLVGIDPADGSFMARHTIAQQSCSVGFSHGALFTAEQSLRYLTKRDPRSGDELAEPIISRNYIWDIDAGHGSIWFVDRPSGVLVRVDPAAHAVVARIDVGIPASGIAVTADAVWVAVEGTDEVARVDPATDAIVARVATADAPIGLAAVGDHLWVSHQSGVAAQVDMRTNELLRVIELEGPLGEPAVAAGSVWVPGQLDGLLRRIDAASGEILAEHYVADQLAAVWSAAGDLWATTYADPYLYRIDPDAG
jgi:streptogramin lyase